jgi:hypothetical protein
MLIDPNTSEIIATYEPGSYGNPEEDQGGGSGNPEYDQGGGTWDDYTGDFINSGGGGGLDNVDNSSDGDLSYDI